MITVVVAVAAKQEPLAGISLVIVYVPAAQESKFISPVFIFTNTKPPGVAEKTPALEPAANSGKILPTP